MLLEDELAEAWCATAEAPLFIDGGISRSGRVASSTNAIGVIKSHLTLYVEGDALKTVVGLAKGERSSVFRVSPRSRTEVMSWYLRLRDAGGPRCAVGIGADRDVEVRQSHRARRRDLALGASRDRLRWHYPMDVGTKCPTAFGTSKNS